VLRRVLVVAAVIVIVSASAARVGAAAPTPTPTASPAEPTISQLAARARAIVAASPRVAAPALSPG
jgi:hypothetical protein